MSTKIKREFTFSKGVLLKGLPFDTNVNEIKVFFKTLSLPDQNIHIIKFRDGKQTGVGFVKLKDEEMEHALLMDKNHIGRRYIEVIASDETELHHLMLKARTGEADAREINRIAGKEAKKGIVRRDRSPIRKHLQTRYAYISGVPPGHQYKEIRQFFSGILIGMNCIHLMRSHEANRAFRGDGYVEFKDSVECRKGLVLDGELMAGSIINVEPCSQDEFEEAIRKHDMWENDRRRSPSPPHRRAGDEYFTPAYREREGRYRNTIATMAYGGRGVIDSARNAYSPEDRFNSRSTGSSYWSRSPPRSFPDSSFDRRSDVGPGFSSLSSYPLSSGQNFGSSPLFGGGSSGSIGSNVLGPQKPLMDTPLLSSRAERKIVRMEGLPYEASLHDIVDFFHGYNIGIEHVRIQCRDDGSPSGKAFVTFPNENFAQNAIQDLNKRYIQGRYVELFLV